MHWIPYSESNQPDYNRRVVLVGFMNYGNADMRPCAAIGELRTYTGWEMLGPMPEKIIAWCYEEDFAIYINALINQPVHATIEIMLRLIGKAYRDGYFRGVEDQENEFCWGVDDERHYLMDLCDEGNYCKVKIPSWK